MKTKDGPRGPGLVFLENVKVKKNQSLEEIVKRESEKPRQTSHSEFSANITKDRIEFSAGKSRKKVPINEILYEHIERILPEERKLRVVLGCMTDYGAYNTFMYYLYEARGWLIESEGNAFSASSFTPKSPETDTSIQYSIQSPGLPPVGELRVLRRLQWRTGVRRRKREAPT
ncbi:unnamed protein product [Dibothriocephalus latus]|uniref:Uncharacterized protein n=1 Tax=Dibothriocephalus latus TaxID=60516 RepID=A0A3P7NI14_DIBLA|nr:unnamed protein product [Dibothriocephalus latus]